MDRLEELENIFISYDEDIKRVIYPLFEEIEFVETQLDELKTKPFIKYHPDNPTIQKATAAGKLYKELLQQEKDMLKILCSILRKGTEGAEESPLRQYLKMLEREA